MSRVVFGQDLAFVLALSHVLHCDLSVRVLLVIDRNEACSACRPARGPFIPRPRERERDAGASDFERGRGGGEGSQKCPSGAHFRGDDAPVSHSQPQILKEVVEVVKAVKNVPQERISEKIGEQIDDDIVPVDQPGDHARCDTQACGDAEKGHSDSDCMEDSGNPAGEVRRQSY